MSYVKRDYYWKRVGLRYEVFKEIGYVAFSTGLRFWRMRTAARVCNQLFGAYHDGRDSERRNRAVLDASREK